MAKRAALAAVAALLLFPAGIGNSYAKIDSTMINSTSVITGTQDDAAKISGTVMKATNNANDIGNLKTAMQNVETELNQHQDLINNLGTDKLTLSSDNTLQQESYDSTKKTTTKTDVTGLKVAGQVSAESGKITNSLEVGHNVNVGSAVNAGSLNSRGNLNVDGNALVKGTLTSQSTINGKEIVSQTNITAKNKVVGMQGVVDNTLTGGNYVTAGNTVGENIVALDTQVKANSTALHISSSDDLIVGTKENQTVKDMKIRGKLTSGSISTGDITSSGDVIVAGKMAADGVTDETTKDGSYIKQNNTVGKNLVSLDKQVKANDERITNVKEYVLSETNKNYVSKTDAALQDDGAIVKKANTIGENVALLDAGLAKETADRLGADAAQDKVIKQVNDNLVASVNTINESVKTTNENMAAGFTALSQTDAAEAAAREAKDNELNERITNEANAIHDEIKAGDTALDERITNVKEYVLSETVSKTDAAVQDGAIVKAANTIGENVTNLDAALAKETAARIGADKAQDKVIQQVNQNMVEGFNTINKNMFDGFTALSQTDANELAGRVAADTELVKATNGGLALNDKNVLQKNETTIAGDGTVTTKTTAADTLIMNEGETNQITLSENGIKVGTNSTVIASDGVFAGGDTAKAAKAALNADGSIKGANGEFTVDTKGNVTSTATVQGATLTDGTAKISNGNIKTNGGFIQTGGGNVNTQGGEVRTNGGKVATSGGEINTGSGNIKTVGGDILTAGGKLNTSGGDIVAGTGDISGQNITASGVLSGDSLTVAKGMTGHNLTLTGGDLDAGAGTIKTTGEVDAGTLNVSGKATVKDLEVQGEFNATTLSSKLDENNYTEIHGGNVTSVNRKVDTKDGKTYTSTSTLTEKGKTETASNGINRNVNKMDATESSNVITNDANGKTSTFEQRVDEILNQINSSATEFSKVDQKVNNITSEVTDGTNTTSSTQTTTAITNTATNGTISNNAKELTNTASDSITNKAENGNISNMASNGTISNEAKTISNKAAEAMTNDAKTITNTASESVTTQIGDGSAVQGVMNESGIANKATGKSITNDAATITNTGTTSVTNQVGNNKVLVDTTHVQSAFGDTIYTTWDENGITNNATDKTVATNAKDILNTATGNMTNTVGGELKTTVTGKVTEDYKSDLDTKVGGNQTTTVTGDSSLTAENINNTASNKITNKAIDVETDASSSIVSKVSNEYGSNTSTQLSYQTKEEMSQADGKTASYLRGAAEEKSQLTDGDKKTTIDTIAGQTNTNITDGTNTSNSLQMADQAASSVTDGTNTTVVNQDAKNLASSITDGTKANNTNNTVDKSEQLIKASDTQYSATSKTATKMEDALVSGSSVIDVIKSLDDAGSPTINSAVTDGTNTTGVTQTAKDITNTAKNGTIANDAQNITNKASETLSNSAKNITNTTTEDMTNTIGRNLTTTVGGDMSTEVTGNQRTIVKGNQNNTVEGTLTETVTGKTTENYNGGLETTITGEEKHTVNGSQINAITGDQTNTISGSKTESVKGAVSETYGSQNTTVNGDQSTTVTGKQTNSITGDQVNTIGGSQTTTVTGDSTLSAKNITNTAKGGTIYNQSKDILNEATGDILNFADGEIGNVATKITNITGDTTVTSDTNGTTFENKAHNTAIKEGTITKTTISGNTLTTGQATMDYAEVMKDLGVHGNATVDQKLTVKGDSDLQGNATVGKDLTVKGNSDLQGNANVGKNLTVNGTSDLKGDVTMEYNATVKKDLVVEGKTTTNELVVNNGATVTGGTTTDTLHVTSTSTFDGAATFKDVVTMKKDLSVGGNATVDGSMTASSYKVDGKTYIDSNGINANNQKIIKVAAGDLSANSTDAVNGAQLYQTNERVTGVENKVNKLDSRVDKVGANAAALANLHPLEFDADSKWNIAAAVGGYKGETATAIGAFYRPNENVMVNVSSSFGTGENMYGGGISLRIGQGGNKARRNATNGLTDREKAMQKQIDSLTNRLDALLSVINPNMSKDFPDVPENHWAYEAVSRLAGNGVIQGYEDGKYHGDRTMTRYEMAEIIYNALSKGAKAEKKLVEEFKPELQAMAAQKKA